MKPTLEYPQWCTEVEEIINSPLDTIGVHEETIHQFWFDGWTPQQFVDYVDNTYADEYDGQPDWAKEWEDFGESYE